MTKNNTVPVLELRRLLYELKDLRPDVGIRFRLLGQMWQNNHFKITRMTERGAVIVSENQDKPIVIRDLNDVMQFELDSPFQTYEPHTHYSVDPSLLQQK